MEKLDENMMSIEGAEGIVIHNNNIVLGMQKPKRWYQLENGKKATIIKTLGGQIEADDNKNSKKALIREVLEEVRGIDKEDIRVSVEPVFTKQVMMRELNPYEKESDLVMMADFYLLEILNKKNIFPNDLPALVEIPIEKFLKLNFSKQGNMNILKEWIIKNEKESQELPEYYALMIPNEVKRFFEKIKGDVER